MDEEQKNEQSPAEKASQDIQDTARAVKDGASLAKNAAAGNYLGAIKDGIKLLKNKKTLKVILISMLLPVIIITLLASTVLVIFNAVGDAIESVIDAVAGLFKIDPDSWDGTIKIEDEDVDKVIQGIKDLNIKIEDLRLAGDIDRNSNDTEEERKEKEEKAARKYVKKFLETQFITETPHYEPTLSSGNAYGQKTYGKVYLYRTSDAEVVDENTKLYEMSWMSYTKMKEEVAKNTRAGLNAVKNHYSIDEDGKLVVAQWTIIETQVDNGKKQEQIIMSLTHINYKGAISQYTTPVNFLVYLTMVSENPEFVIAVTEMIKKNTKIDITLLDTVTKNVEVETYTRTNWSKGVREVTKQGTTVKVPYRNSSNAETVTTTTTTSTIPVPKVTYAKTWFSEQRVTYNLDLKEETFPTRTFPGEDDPEPSGDTGSWTTNKVTKIDSNRTTTKYKEGTRGNVEYKGGKKGDQGVTVNPNSYKNKEKREVKDNFYVDDKTTFVGLMDDFFRIPNSKEYEAAGKTNLDTGAEWLFYLLQKNSNLQNLEKVMRYVMYQYTGRDYGVTTFDDDIFGIRDFPEINLEGSAQLKRYIRYWEHSSEPPKNSDKTKYIIEDDGYGHLTVGYGVDIENSGYKQKFIDAGYTIKEGAEVDIAFVDAIEDEIIESSKKSVQAIVSGLNLAEHQINALVSRAYNCGVSGALSVERGNPSKNFIDSYNSYWNEETDDLYKNNPNATEGNYNHQLYKQYMSRPTTSAGQYSAGLERRRKSEWTLFQTGYYDVLGERQASFSGETVTIDGLKFPLYLQKDFPGPYGTSTIPSSGCGPTSLAMILSGLLRDPSITPWSVVNNIDKNWPNGAYYVPGVGSSHCIFNNSFLSKYYGVSSSVCYPSEAEVIQALKEGAGVIGAEEGHILAIVPVPDEYKNQGYQFYILDSARGHSGAYRSVADANRVVKGNLSFIAIIRP